MLAVAVLCAGCTTTASRKHLDDIAKWQKTHAETLPQLLDAFKDNHTATTRARIQARLTTKKTALADELRLVALERIAACGADPEERNELAKEKKNIERLREQIGDAEADNLSRMANVPQVYRLTHKLIRAQQRYWNSQTRYRATCATAVRRRLDQALFGLNRKMEDALHCIPEWILDLPERWRECQVEVQNSLTTAQEHINELKRCEFPWRRRCNDPKPTCNLLDAPLLGCLAILATAPAKLEEAIVEAERLLVQDHDKAVVCVRGPAPKESQSGCGAHGDSSEKNLSGDQTQHILEGGAAFVMDGACVPIGGR